MPDYSLGKASGKIEIDYDGTGVSKAIVDLDKATKSSEDLEKSLTKTEKTLSDTDKQFNTSGNSAQGYSQRLRDVEKSSQDVSRAEKDYQRVLLDEKATLSDIEQAHERVTSAKRKHTQATNAERDANRALTSEMGVGQHVLKAFGDIIPSIERHFQQLATTQTSVASKTNVLSKSLGALGKASALLGPEAKGLAAALELTAKGVDKTASSASTGSHHVRNFIKDIADFEKSFGKISGMTLALPALGGLAGIGGASALMGIVEVADAVKQLSGALGLLPAAVAGGALVMGTMKIALHGVKDSLKDMMADDPKKFLDDIKDMAPSAAHAMLQIAQFRSQFKLAGGAIQDSFFTKINADIVPLIQTLLPAVTAGMSKIAGVMGGAADQFAKLLMQPATMAAFTALVDNVSKGLTAMEPAMKPLLDIFSQLTVVGSSFFQQIGGAISHVAQFFDDVITKANSSGALKDWIATGIEAFEHLTNILYSAGSAFMKIMDVADKFGGGGLLGFLDQLTMSINSWVSSAAGQKTLSQFFDTLRQATDAFLPMLKPFTEGMMSIVNAFVLLGTTTGDAWLGFFKAFAETMNKLGPQIVGMGPAITTFLEHLGGVMVALMQKLGPQLPAIFDALSNAFVALLPQIPILVSLFAELVERVGPQLPQLFESVTEGLVQLQGAWPEVIELVRTFITVVNDMVDTLGAVTQYFATVAKDISGAWDAIGNFFKDLPEKLQPIDKAVGAFFDTFPDKALNWGKALIAGFIKGIEDGSGLSSIDRAMQTVMNGISKWVPRSPAKVGPFSGSGYTLTRGQNMVRDLAAGMVSQQGVVSAAAHSTMVAASNGLTAGAAAAAGGAAGSGAAGGGSPHAAAAGGADAVGGALLPDNIAGADTSILSAYLRHQFPENRGLKGLAKSMGSFLQVFQSGANLLFQNALQPMMQAFGMLGKIPALSNIFGSQSWHKLSPKESAAQQLDELQRKALEGKQGPKWGDLGLPGGAPADQQIPLGLSAGSSKQDIQKAIIAAGRARGMNDAQIQTALAIAADESNFNGTIIGKGQGAGGADAYGTYQQSAPGWGTQAQLLDPNFAINAFFNAYAQQLAKNPTDPMLAGVLTQNPQLGAGAKGSQYWNAVAAKLGLGGEILKQLGPDVKDGPTWPQVTGGAPGLQGPGGPTGGGPPQAWQDAPGGWKFMKNGDQQFWVPPGTALPPIGAGGRPQAGGKLMWATGPNNAMVLGDSHSTVGPNGKWTGPAVPGVPGPPPGQPPVGGQFPVAGALPNLQGVQLPNVRGAHEQLAYALAAIQQLFPTATLNAGKDDHGVDQGWHPRGQAIDIGAPGDNPQTLAAISNYLLQFAPNIEELIHSGPGVLQNIKSGKLGPAIDMPGSVYNSGQAGYHGDHVHLAITDQMAAAFEAALGNGQPPGAVPLGSGIGTGGLGLGGPGSTGYPDVDNANAVIAANSGKQLSVNERLLQAYLQGNPALASQIDAAKTPGAPDEVVRSTLNSLGTTIATLKQQDAIGNKNTIDALQNTQSQIAQSSGFVQGQSGIQIASSIASGASSAVSSVIQTIQGGLDALTATQDLADRGVYGISNTKDVSKVIDDFQKYITFAADIANSTGSILSTIGGLVGAGGSADPSGASSGAAMALSAAGQIAQLIGSALQAVNAGIDFAQQAMQIVGGYVGKFLTSLTGPGGTPLMGDIRYLLNTNTGQLISYSQDNPQNQNVQNLSPFAKAIHGYGNANPNPQVNTQWNIYAGPGQPVNQMLNETMWMVNTSGTTGAMAPANF